MVCSTMMVDTVHGHPGITIMLNANNGCTHANICVEMSGDVIAIQHLTTSHDSPSLAMIHHRSTLITNIIEYHETIRYRSQKD